MCVAGGYYHADDDFPARAMLRDRPTLASVSLCLACLLALLPEAAAKPRCTQDVLQTLQVLEGKVPSKVGPRSGQVSSLRSERSPKALRCQPLESAAATPP